MLARDWGPRLADFSEEDVFGCDGDLNIEIVISFDEPSEHRKLKDADPIVIGGLQFTFDRYERGPTRGQRRLEQKLLATDGSPIKSIQASYGKAGQPPKFDPIYAVPQDVRQQIPLIYIGTNRTLQEQLPSARHSLLRRMFEDIDAGFRDPNDTIPFKQPDGTEVQRPRLDAFYYLMERALKLLRTDDFVHLETTIKRNALEQLGLDTRTDEVDLYFTPMESMDFYKCLDLHQELEPYYSDIGRRRPRQRRRASREGLDAAA